ncbi:sigma 54-interacting transcriptional regulator [candidate division WOR-3 bacterium]|nr:sigma 54-interacting transcriptional regulator [candidate division WOR-3 bacterium]
MPIELSEQMLEALGDGVAFIDKDLHIVSWSESAERITHHSAGKVLGKNCKDIFKSELCEKNCPVQKVIKTGKAVSNIIVNIQTANGIKIPISINATPLKNVNHKIVGAILAFRNIAELQTISSELLNERNRLHAIVESIADGVFTVNAEWKITSFNQSAEKITGFKREAAIGKECRLIFRSNVCKENCPLRKTMETGKPISNFEIEILTKNHKKIPVAVSTALLIDEEGEIMGGVETFRDLSKIKYLSKELAERYSFSNIVGKNPKMQEIYDLLGIVSETSATVLVLGETGTGKELVARAIHYNSPRKDKPFIKVLCANLSENLLESELFGHTKGAFTGAIRDKPGRFELANEGTIFLDEIGEIPGNVQAKLLRVLEDGEFERIGGTKTVKADVRIIAATNRDLKQLIKDRKFRQDLYYRLNVVSISLPPLREKRDDIPILVKHFIQKFRKKTGKNIENVSPQVMDILIDYNWPGNVRELENAVEHAFVHCRSKIIQTQHLPDEIKPDELVGAGLVPARPSGELTLDELEKKLILEALKKNNWNKLKTAKALKFSRTTLWRKIKKHKITIYPKNLSLI